MTRRGSDPAGGLSPSSSMVRRVGILDRLTGTAGRLDSPESAGPVVLLSETPPESAPIAVNASDDVGTFWEKDRAHSIALSVARSIPAVRKAEHVIAGTLGTFTLRGKLNGATVPTTDPRCAWLAQPDPAKTSQAILTRTALDLLWYDRCVWKIADRTILKTPTAAKRIHPDRIDVVRNALDPDEIDAWIIDGHEHRDPISAGYIVFDAAGLGGLRTFGYPLLTLYGELQVAAGRYAKAPHPAAILKNHGPDLTDKEIDELLDGWSWERRSRGIGYLNDAVDYDTVDGSWSAADLQLTEAREHAAVEVARLFGLPAFALDAKGGDPMTYSNRVDRRRDTLDALLPWRTVFEQTLSMTDRRARPATGIAVPAGMTVALDVDEYARADAPERMGVWRELRDLDLATTEQIAAMEPLAGRNPR